MPSSPRFHREAGPARRSAAPRGRARNAGAWSRVLAAALLVFTSGPGRAEERLPGHQALLREVHRELVEINTAPSGGATTHEAARRMEARLRDAGFSEEEVEVLGPTSQRSMLLARYRAAAPTQRPVLLLAHLDVVEALRDDWSFDPFTHLEKDGWFYGRGSYDNKAGAAILVTAFSRLRKEGYAPGRDLILLLTADEETDALGLQWLLAEHRHRMDAEFALNTDSGYVLTTDGEAREIRVQTGEKIYADYAVEIRNHGGHSSEPRSDNPIYALAALLAEIGASHFPIDLNVTTQAAFAHFLPHAPEETRPLVRALADGRITDPVLDRLPAFPYLNAMARTTCVATMLNAGHAVNALPQTARAVINCRLLPQAPIDSAQRRLESLAAKHGARVETLYAPVKSPPSALTPALTAHISLAAQGLWPGLPLVPEMETGATDALFLRNAGIPTFGLSGLEKDPADDRTHGRDERVGVEALYRAGDFWYRLLRELGRN